MAALLVDVVRSPRGKANPNGGLAKVAPPTLVGHLVRHLVGEPSAADVDGLILGCVGQVGAQGSNVALMTKLQAGLPDRAFAYSLNNFCVSSLTAIGQAAGMVETRGARRVLAGGVEHMSTVPFLADQATYYTDPSLPERIRYVPVPVAADRLAVAENVTRAELDTVGLRSQQLAAAAETVPALQRSRVAIPGALAFDECARPKTTAESLAKLPPAFGGLHTLGHAPPICDGAALALVTATGPARARIRGYADVGGDSQASLTAGFVAMELALARAGVTWKDLDRVELMEAFAVVVVKFLREERIDPARVNVAGGHLAKGHPMGATGALLVSQLLDALDHADGTLGLVVATGTTGVGAAMVVEKI